MHAPFKTSVLVYNFPKSKMFLLRLLLLHLHQDSTKGKMWSKVNAIKYNLGPV
jgi:hypothetical protein